MQQQHTVQKHREAATHAKKKHGTVTNKPDVEKRSSKEAVDILRALAFSGVMRVYERVCRLAAFDSDGGMHAKTTG